jgi:hypothetical protein
MLFFLNPKSKRPDSFYLGLTIAGYLTLAIVLYCFGRSIVRPANCDVPECWDRAYAQDPAALLLLVPGVALGLLGVLQLRLNRRCSGAANRRILTFSFKCSALASVGLCVDVGLANTDDAFVEAVRLIIGLSSAVFLLLGIVLSLVNIVWNLLSRSPLTESQT